MMGHHPPPRCPHLLTVCTETKGKWHQTLSKMEPATVGLGRCLCTKNPRCSQNSKVINTHWPLDVGEAAKQEGEIEPGQEGQEGQEGNVPSGHHLDENGVLHVIIAPPPRDHTLNLLLRSVQFQHHLMQGQHMKWSHNGPWSQRLFCILFPFHRINPTMWQIHSFISEG